MKTVYLAGPITGLTYDGAADWRAVISGMFETIGVKALSPLRGKQYLRTFGELEHQYHGVHPLSEASGIVARDRNDCTRSDAVIANFLGADRVSIGTVMECAWADLARVPLILVMEPEGNVHDHAMVTDVAGWRTDDLEDAWAIAATVLGYDVNPLAGEGVTYHEAERQDPFAEAEAERQRRLTPREEREEQALEDALQRGRQKGARDAEPVEPRRDGRLARPVAPQAAERDRYQKPPIQTGPANRKSRPEPEWEDVG